MNVYQLNNNTFDKNILKLQIPILGICFGHQILSKFSGGKVKSSKQREFGLAQVLKKKESLLTKNFFNKKNFNKVWMSHSDQVSKLPKKFKVIASTKNSKFAIVENDQKKFFGVQFHPEASPGPQDSHFLFENFAKMIENNAKKK